MEIISTDIQMWKCIQFYTEAENKTEVCLPHMEIK